MSARIGHFKNTLYCSFCGKGQHEVVKLIAGPVNVFICDECVRSCIDLIIADAEEATKTNAAVDKALRDWAACKNCKPEPLDG